MRDKILILGNGFLGGRLREALQCDISERKILSYEDIQAEIDKYQPKVLINCIGFTGKNNVDGCELEKDKTISANVFIPVILAEAALRNNIKLVHISSGCIYHYDYSRDEPITEAKEPDFFELFYSRTKIYAEKVLEIMSRRYPVLIIRIRVPLDNRPHQKNILTKLINYKKVIDLPNSVTYIPDFIQALKHLVKIDAQGIYNVVIKDPLIYSELMEAYKKEAPEFKYEVIKFQEINSVRTNLVLSTEKLEKTGFKVRSIHEMLEECVKEYLRY